MGSGTLVGHALPASFFFGFGCFFLLLTLKRCRDLDTKSRKNGQVERLSFADVHFPENPKVLLRSGTILMICTAIGGAVEAGGGMKDGLGFFHQLAHEAMYLSVFFTGAVCVLEGNNLLFADAHKCALAFTFLMQYILWNEHALMKEEPSDLRVHLLQAQVNFVAFLGFGYSAYNPKSLLAHVISWAVTVLNATWMLTAGLTACCIDIMRHTVGAVLVLEALLIAAVIVVCASCFLDHPVPHRRGENKEGVVRNVNYSTVSSNESDFEMA